MSARVALVAALLASLPSPAAARRVVAFPLGGAVPGDPGDALERFTQVVARAAGLAGAEVTSAASSFDDAAALAGCATPDAACMSLLAAQLGADELIVGTVAPAPGGPGVVVTLLLYRDGAVDEQAVGLAGPDVDAMVAQLARAAAPLFVGAGTPPDPEPPVAEPPRPPDPPPVANVPLPPRPERGLAHVRPVWWIVAGAGVLVVATGVYFLFDAASMQDEIDAAPTATVADLERLRGLEDDAASSARLGNVLSIAGGVAVLVGGVFVARDALTWHTPEARVTAGLVPLAGGAAATLEVRW